MTITDELLSYLPDAVITVDADQTIVFANAGAGEIFGREPHTLIGQPLELLIPHRHRAAHRGHVDRFLHSEEAGRFMGQRGEITGLRASGEEFPAEASFVKSLSGGAAYLTAMVRDITKRKRREGEIAAGKAKQHAILEAGPDAILCAELDSGRIMEANTRAGDLFGCAAEDLVGLHHTELHPPATRETYRQTFRDHIEHRRFFVPDARIQRWDGDVLPVEISAKPITIHGAVMMVGYFRDISHWKEREQELVETQRQLHAQNETKQRLIRRFKYAQDMANLGHFTRNFVSNEQHWSEQVDHIFGCDQHRDNSDYRTFADRVHPDDSQIIEDAIDDALNERGDFVTRYRIRRPDGEERVVREQGEIVWNADGTPCVLEGIVQDITEDQHREAELEKAKKRAERASEAKSRFLSMMSHELRTPLNAVSRHGGGYPRPPSRRRLGRLHRLCRRHPQQRQPPAGFGERPARHIAP